MATRKTILRIMLAVSLIAVLCWNNSPQAEEVCPTGQPSSGYTFVTGCAPVAAAQASYLVAVPSAASMELPSRAGIAEASQFLSSGQTMVFRCMRQILPLPSDGGKRRLLLKVLRI